MDDNTLLLFEDISEAETRESTPVYEYDEPEENNPETEAETETYSEISDVSEDSSGENINEELTDRLDALIDILTPEESEESETGNSSGAGEDESTDDVLSAPDAYTHELLENINGTLVAIKWENYTYYSEMLAYQEQMASNQTHMAECFEYCLISIFFIGFFVAFSCGCSLANVFFNRMRG